LNVVVILCDSWRWDHFGFNGNDWIETPRLDAFSKECAIIDNAYTEGLPTLPQRTAAFTGRFTFPWRGWENMRPEDERLAQKLFAANVHTALISDSMPMFTMGHGYTQWFDHVDFIRGQAGCAFTDEMLKAEVDMERVYPPGRVVNHPGLQKCVQQFSVWKTDEQHLAAQVVKSAIKWIDGYDKPQPFMLWLDTFDPHEPWNPPEEFWRKYDPDYDGQLMPICPFPRQEGFSITEREAKVVRALYAGECTMVDKWVGIFIDHLRDRGLLDDTLVIFTSDHGEPLGDGTWGHGLWRKFAPWPYDELAHAPLLIRHPKKHGAGKRFSTFFQSCDLAATVLDAFGREPSDKMHSRSVLPVLRGDKESIRDFAVACHSKQSGIGASRSIRTPDWTFMYWPRGKPAAPPSQLVAEGVTELYRRSEDATEQNNVVEDYPEVARELELQLRQFEDELIAGG